MVSDGGLFYFNAKSISLSNAISDQIDSSIGDVDYLSFFVNLLKTFPAPSPVAFSKKFLPVHNQFSLEPVAHNFLLLRNPGPTKEDLLPQSFTLNLNF